MPDKPPANLPQTSRKAPANRSRSIGHPAPERSTKNNWHSVVALFGTPAAWALQMSLSAVVSSNVCGNYALDIPAFFKDHVRLFLALISLACFALALVLNGFAWNAWRKIRAEQSRSEKHVIEVGEGRAKFLIMLGFMNSILFITAIMFTACALMVISPCKP